MNRKFFIIGYLFLVSLSLNAAQRTVSEATKEANKFLSQSTLRSTGDIQLAYTSMENTYYVFNRPDDSGFVIISGDDKAKTVLGYADNGIFDYSSLPDNFKYWLSCYEKELKSLTVQEHVMEITQQNPKAAPANFAPSVTPLVDAKWGQSTPYNNLCPIIPDGKPNAGRRTVTGCVATAIAQIMKYYEWPLSYSFSKSYSTQTLNININESFNGVYDWTNMINSYSGPYTPANQTAVSTLMYHCGVAVYMDYDTESGAYSFDVPPALQLFGYDRNMQIYMRDYYTNTEWKNMLMTELSAGRPVFYSGVSSSDGGHAFVCDGYDTNEFFHFNWGWSGYANGYFELSALNPPAYDFNFEQTIVTGIQKPNPASVFPPHQIFTDNPLSPDQTSVGRRQNFSITVNGLWNMGAHTFDGYLGFRLSDVNDQPVYDKAKYITGSVPSFEGWTEVQFDELSIPLAGISNGNYRLYITYSTNGVEWHNIKAPIGVPSYINVTITSTTIYFSLPTHIQTPSVSNTVRVYPNPADNELRVESGKLKVESGTICDITGKFIFDFQLSTQIDVSGLPSGVYFLKLETDEGIISTKFIKK